MKKKCSLRNSAFRHQVVPRDFLNHAHNCQYIYQKKDIERCLHVCHIDIYVSVDNLRVILAFATLTLRTRRFLNCIQIYVSTM